MFYLFMQTYSIFMYVVFTFQIKTTYVWFQYTLARLHYIVVYLWNEKKYMEKFKTGKNMTVAIKPLLGKRQKNQMNKINSDLF